ncbi:MAG: F0F1 ATP synthase subunit delta [Verrucomicrobiota bacterium]
MKVSKDAQRTARQLLQLCFLDGKFSGERALQVMKGVREKNPRGALMVLSAFGRLVKLEQAKRHTLIQSAEPLDAATQSQLERTLKSKYGEDLTFEFTTQPALLGGLRIQVGSDVWDGSVQARLHHLSEAL